MIPKVGMKVKILKHTPWFNKDEIVTIISINPWSMGRYLLGLPSYKYKAAMQQDIQNGTKPNWIYDGASDTLFQLLNVFKNTPEDI